MQSSQTSHPTMADSLRWRFPTEYEGPGWWEENIDIVASIGRAMCNQGAEGAVKTVEDLDRYAHLIDTVRPGAIVECGTFQGKSALWFQRHADCPVFTIDVEGDITYDTYKAWGGKVRMFIGSSTDETLVAHITGLVAGLAPIMVVLDSDHSGPHVADELRLWAPLVTPGSYCVVEDTLVRYMPWFHYKGSPYDAVDAFLADHDDWIADRQVEQMYLTSQHPGGWLRRLR